jgi:hypothetical protein
METQYFIVISVLVFIVWYYYNKHKKYHQKKKDVKTDEKKNPIEEIIEQVESVVKRVIPVPTLTPKVWTYVEPISYKKKVHRLNNPGGIPDFFQLCVDKMKQDYSDLVVLTPKTISNYLDDFPIVMGPYSDVPLKRRIDILFACILEKYGGICISPGTIIQNISELVHHSDIKDIVTSGTSPRILSASLNPMTPDTMVIGGKEGSPFLKQYKQKLLHLQSNTSGQLSTLEAYDILSSLLQEQKPPQFHVSSLTDGTRNKYLQKIDINVFLSNTTINYSDTPLFFISFPYQDVYQKQYRWFLNLSKKELLQSNIAIIQYLI